jgi:hypothetical protein
MLKTEEKKAVSPVGLAALRLNGLFVMETKESC